MIKMIVFLGNKGKQYEKTRHNVAWIFYNYLKMKLNLDDLEGKFNGLYTKSGNNIYLLPQKMMNLSGDSVAKAMDFFKLKTEEILIVHDDLETPFGSFKIKLGGGLGGHNGLRSIKEKIGSQEFFRLAIGISRPKHGSVSSHVLGRFTNMEESELEVIMNGMLSDYNLLIDQNSFQDGKKIKILQLVEDV